MRSGLIEDEVSTESCSDRVIVLAISIIAIGFYPVATALGTDSMTSAGFLPQIRPLPSHKESLPPTEFIVRLQPNGRPLDRPHRASRRSSRRAPDFVIAL